ncbi:ABC transporter ATP-binding protein [Pseudomonas sp. HR96]|uniref:ABC transporter ATP-binding protein n=1 Tax=Pseudomonas sp. HR96 TaxID=1027966 RepID=UPI002A74B95C|nr:ABC transporter ATP-binding protein [Pseudomonas sp. HR96]WPO97600.1 ABC transporter ATP-binding protein [Pseudomonas sp. HR96]
MSALEILAVHKQYAGQPAVADIRLAVASGSRTAIVGPSGSGKTTLLRLIAGFEFPDQGTIRLAGRTLFDEATALPAHQRQVGYVPQDGALFAHLSVADNIGFGLSGSRRARRPQVQALLEQVSLAANLIDRWPHELSGGQQQRVALARALAQRPRLMLLDEPFSALDTGLRANLRKAVAQVLGEAGITTLLVTHDQAEALSFADQLAVMRNGWLVQAGDPQALYRAPVDEETAGFLGEAIILPAQVAAGGADCALGRVAVGATAPPGPGRLLLRAEQLCLAEVGAPGQVLSLEFNGSHFGVEVRLDAGPLLSLRVPSAAQVSVGDRVRIGVSGQAHVFNARLDRPWAALPSDDPSRIAR